MQSHVCAAFAIRHWFHAKRDRHALIKTAAGIIARVIHGTRHRVAAFKSIFEPCLPLCVGILVRRNADDPLEYALQMKRTQCEFRREFVQRWNRLVRVFEIAAYRDHQVVMSFTPFAARITALARAVVRVFSGGGRGKKLDVLWFGAA